MILVDTSVWIEFFTKKGLVSSLVFELLEGNNVAICGPVLTEITRGFVSEKQKDEVLQLFEGCRELSQPHQLWEDAGTIGFSLKTKRIGTVDLLIACYALAHRVTLFTTDNDFRILKKAGIPLDLFEY